MHTDDKCNDAGVVVDPQIHADGIAGCCGNSFRCQRKLGALLLLSRLRLVDADITGVHHSVLDGNCVIIGEVCVIDIDRINAVRCIVSDLDLEFQQVAVKDIVLALGNIEPECLIAADFRRVVERIISLARILVDLGLCLTVVVNSRFAVDIGLGHIILTVLTAERCDDRRIVVEVRAECQLLLR